MGNQKKHITDCNDSDDGHESGLSSPSEKEKDHTAVSIPPSSNGILSCAGYSFCSVSMVLANKSLASSFHSGADVTIVASQCVVAVLLVEGCRLAGLVEYASFQLDVALRWLPINIFFVLMLQSGFLSLHYLSVPMVTIFKNLTNVLTVAGEWYFYDVPVSPGVIGSLAVMLLGAVFAARADLSFSAPGYAWQLINCFSTSAYVLSMKRATKTINLSKFGMVFYNNLLSIGLLLPIALVRGEAPLFLKAIEQPGQGQLFLLTNAFCGCVGFVLNLASLWCVASTSATTYAIVGAVNKVPIAMLGMLLFNSPISSEGAVYISVSMIGGFLYSWSKLREK